MDYLHAVILGVVEGLTEYLPVSSTGHLILASHLLALPDTDFVKTFEIVIQLGAILAVVFLYWRRLFLEREVMKRIIVALLPALGVGYVFYAAIKQLLGSETVVLWSLLIGGIIILVVECFQKGKAHSLADVATLPYKTVFAVGLCQALSVIPGVSRAGATIVGGLLLGMKRETIVEFSFLLAVPTMVAATALTVYKNVGVFSVGNNFHLLVIGFVVAFGVALVTVGAFLRYAKTHTFVPFGVYRIVVAILFLLFLL